MKQVYSQLKPVTGAYTVGICSIKIAPREWLTANPIIDFSTGKITTALSFLSGKDFIEISLLQDTYIYDEKPKLNKEGSYFELSISGILNDISAATQQILNTYRYHEMVVIFEDKQKRLRIGGSKDAGMLFQWNNKETSAAGGNQVVSISLDMQSEYPAPFYELPVTFTNPDDLPNLWGWWKADSGVVGADPVTSWNDNSVNNDDLVFVDPLLPTLQTNALNGLPVVESISYDAYLTTTNNVPDMAGGCTIFIVGKQQISADPNGPFIEFGSSQKFNIRRYNNSNNILIFSATGTSGPVDLLYAGIPDGFYHTLRLRHSGNTLFACFDTTTELDIPCQLASYSGTPLKVFSNGTINGQKAIAEIIIYTRSLDNDEINLVENYLRTKYAHY